MILFHILHTQANEVNDVNAVSTSPKISFEEVKTRVLTKTIAGPLYIDIFSQLKKGNDSKILLYFIMPIKLILYLVFYVIFAFSIIGLIFNIISSNKQYESMLSFFMTSTFLTLIVITLLHLFLDYVNEYKEKLKFNIFANIYENYIRIISTIDISQASNVGYHNFTNIILTLIDFTIQEHELVVIAKFASGYMSFIFPLLIIVFLSYFWILIQLSKFLDMSFSENFIYLGYLTCFSELNMFKYLYYHLALIIKDNDKGNNLTILYFLIFVISSFIYNRVILSLIIANVEKFKINMISELYQLQQYHNTNTDSILFQLLSSVYYAFIIIPISFLIAIYSYYIFIAYTNNYNAITSAMTYKDIEQIYNSSGLMSGAVNNYEKLNTKPVDNIATIINLASDASDKKTNNTNLLFLDILVQSPIVISTINNVVYRSMFASLGVAVVLYFNNIQYYLDLKFILIGSSLKLLFISNQMPLTIYSISILSSIVDNKNSNKNLERFNGFIAKIPGIQYRHNTYSTEFGFSENVVNVMTDIDMHIHAESISTLKGPSGSGKSSIFSAITAQNRSSTFVNMENTVIKFFNEYKEYKHSKLSSYTILSKILYLPQLFGGNIPYNMTLKDILNMFYINSKIEIEIYNYITQVLEINLPITRVFGTLSTGQKKSIIFAIVWTIKAMTMPNIILVDEWQGLDIHRRKTIFDRFKENKNVNKDIFLIMYEYAKKENKKANITYSENMFHLLFTNVLSHAAIIIISHSELGNSINDLFVIHGRKVETHTLINRNTHNLIKNKKNKVILTSTVVN